MSDKAISSRLESLIERLSSQESLELEFKSARGGLPKEIWPTVSAFANTAGGWIVLGIAERQDEIAIEGVEHADTLLHNLHSQLRNEQKISYEVCKTSDIIIEELDQKPVVVIRVPAAPRKARPVYTNGNPYGGTYVRRHSGDYHAAKQEVDRMMREASDLATDSTILKHFIWNDLDTETFAGYRRRYQTRNPASPWNNYGDQQFLRAVGGYRLDRETGDEGITAAGLLLFGTQEALREWRTRHLIDYRLLSNESETSTTWDDRIVWEGNLLGAFDTLYPRLVSGLPTPFRLEGGTRVDESPIHVALREALVNLLVHADYSESQTSLIIRSPEGYRFRNPGSSRVPESDLFEGDRSDPRNPILVQMFRYIGLAEEAGTGIPRILQAWRAQGFQMPSFVLDTERYEFGLVLRHAHLLSEDDREWLSTLGSGWSEAEQLALVIARHEGKVDNVSLRRMTGQHPADVTKVLGTLRSRGLLRMLGSGRGAWYQLGPAITGEETMPFPEQISLFDGSTGNEAISVADGHPDSLGSDAKGTNLESSGANSTDFPQYSPGSASNSSDISARLGEIAAKARQQHHLNAQTLGGMIVHLCALKPLSRRELSQLLQRNQSYIHGIIQALVSQGRLSYLHPEQPNHPGQKYRAVSIDMER